MISSCAYSYCDAMERIGNTINDKYSRVYAGSYFCDQYFLGIPEADWKRLLRIVRSGNLKVTLVIPIASQIFLDAMKEKIKQLFILFGDALDEVTVNDFGMFDWIRKHNTKVLIWCGRLLVKDTRDLRTNVTRHQCKLLDHLSNGQLMGNPVAGIEIDTFVTPTIDVIPSVMLAFHNTYSYLTVGRICEIGSIGKEVKDKFRLDRVCMRQCEKTWIRYEADGNLLIKYGRAVFGKVNMSAMIESLPESVKLRMIEDDFATKVDSE